MIMASPYFEDEEVPEATTEMVQLMSEAAQSVVHDARMSSITNVASVS